MELEDFLITAGKVPVKQMKYYLIWISKYNTYIKKYKQNNDQDYFDSLSGKYNEWQVIQAQRAVNLYKYYLSSQTIKKEELAVSAPDSWNDVEEKVKESCKIQYKSKWCY